MAVTRRERARQEQLRRRKRYERAGFVAVSVLVMLVPSLRAPAPGAVGSGLPPAAQPPGDDPLGSGSSAAVASTAVGDTSLPLGRLRIPAIGLDTDFYRGVSDGVLDQGPGLWPGTPAPGSAGNSVLAGLRTTPPAPFAALDELEGGDEVVVSGAAGEVMFAVVATLVVDASDYAAVVLAQPEDADERILTLFACHPRGSTEQRIIVRARIST